MRVLTRFQRTFKAFISRKIKHSDWNMYTDPRVYGIPQIISLTVEQHDLVLKSNISYSNFWILPSCDASSSSFGVLDSDSSGCDEASQSAIKKNILNFVLPS